MEISRRLNKAVLALDNKFATNPVNNVFGISRTLLALSTLLTLIANNPRTIFIASNFPVNSQELTKQINLFYLFGFEHLYVAQIIAVVILLLVIAGFYPKITAVLHWWVAFSFFTSAIIVDGGDQINQNLTLFFIPLSFLDGRKNHWQTVNPLNNSYSNYLASLVLLLIKLQVCVIYLHAAMAKTNVEEWVDGSAVYYWLNNNFFGAPSYLQKWILPLLENAYVVWTLTWGTIIFELLMAGSIFFTKTRRILMLKLGLVFHFSFFVLFGLGSFFFAMAGALFVYLAEDPLYLSKPSLWIKAPINIIRNGRSLIKAG